MKKAILLFVFAIISTMAFASNTSPKDLSEAVVESVAFEKKTTNPCADKEPAQQYVYCGVWNGVTFCAASDNQGTAIGLWFQMCESLGCC